jgi:hypothetical protein
MSYNGDKAPEVTGELVDYYKVWGPSRFRNRTGEPLGQRALQLKVYEFNLPIIKTGHNALIDSLQGDECLRRHARIHTPRKRRAPAKAAAE